MQGPAGHQPSGGSMEEVFGLRDCPCKLGVRNEGRDAMGAVNPKILREF